MKDIKIQKIIEFLKYLNINWSKTKTKIIHVAGTNGKGSTCEIIEKILIESNYNVGKFTSPHIINSTERIQYNNKKIDEKTLEKLIKKVDETAINLNKELNFFEQYFLAANIYFFNLNLDFLILEVGIGGRLDTTNALDADFAIITNVSKDHTDILGNTIDEISNEKAGIVKNKSKVIFNGNNEYLKRCVIEKTSNYVDIHEKYKNNVTYDLDIKDLKTVIKIDNEVYELPLFGEHQIYNFLIAYELGNILGISNEIIKKSLKNINIKGRFEKVVYNNIEIILDGAHNIDGIETIMKLLYENYNLENIGFVISFLKTKDKSNIIKEIEKYTKDIVITSLESYRNGMTISELRDELGSKYKYIDNTKEAINYFIENNKKIVIFFGSFYLISKYKNENNII